MLSRAGLHGPSSCWRQKSLAPATAPPASSPAADSTSFSLSVRGMELIWVRMWSFYLDDDVLCMGNATWTVGKCFSLSLSFLFSASPGKFDIVPSPV